MLILFFSGSVLGWCIETVFRRFSPANKSRKWINPGFLTGPYLPIYGFGITALYILSNLEAIIPHPDGIFSKIILILVMTASMTLLELFAGLIFVCGMNLKLWDYSQKPFNYKGIICLEFSVYWMILSIIYYFFLHERIVLLIDTVATNLPAAFSIGALMGIFLVDFGYSMHIATKIRSFAAENGILVRYEELKRNICRHAEETKERYCFIFAFGSKIPLHEHLTRYVDMTFKKFKDARHGEGNK